MTGKLSPRVGEARDTAVSHYVFEAPVRLWHWLTVACMLVLMVTGYFIGRPLPSQLVARRFHRGPLVSVSGEKTGERHRT